MLYLIILALLYNYFGLLVTIEIVIWTIIFLLPKSLIRIPLSTREFYVIKFMSFVVIIFILYYNTQQINSLTALILTPLILNLRYYLSQTLNWRKHRERLTLIINCLPL